MLLIDQTSREVPFTLLFAEKIDSSLYAGAIKDSRELADTYNPETQTSDFSIYAGTSLTYDNTYCGYGLGTEQDDNKQVDA